MRSTSMRRAFFQWCVEEQAKGQAQIWVHLACFRASGGEDAAKAG
jgi:hypothetical protein